jgi:hypothetical protein
MSAPTGPARQAFAYAAIIIHPSENRILALPAAAGWALPRWTLDDGSRPYWQTVDGVNRALRERFGLVATTLRCLGTDYDPQTATIANSYAAELRGADQELPAEHRWLGPGEAEAEAFAHPADRALLGDWFAGRLGDLDGPPWFRPGWAAGALAWVAAQAAHLGRAPVAPAEQVRSWERGSIWRAETDAGALYFKAVPPVFAHEVALPAMLNTWRPGSATEVVASDEARGWMLMADLGDHDLFGVRDLALWEAALRAYAELQVACIARRDELLARGCPHRSLADIPAGLDALLADEAAFLPGEEGGLPAEQIARLRDLAPELKAGCAELAALGIPETLDHGDLWASNIFLDGGASDGVRFHDWSDSAVTHPFFGPLLTLLDADIAFPGTPGARDRLRDAYLAPWATVVPPDRLRRAFALAQRLAPLDHALLYHRRILPAMRAKWEMAMMLPYFAGLL